MAQEPRKITTLTLRGRKQAGPKIAAVTAYDATLARLLDEGGADVLLVGDSLGMVVQGNENTLSVTVEEMCYHGRAVARGAKRAHVVGDMPFMSFQVSTERALEAAGQMVKQGRFEAVKLEGGKRVAEAVRRIVEAGIPVMGHVGLTPQSVHAMGGFRVQGKSDEAAAEILSDAKALEEAGVYAMVIEGVPRELGRRITESVSVPTIGIGAGPDCDGQVLVCYDFLGMYGDIRPKFVKRFAELGDGVVAATARYVSEVQGGAFPGAEHTFGGGAPANGVKATPAQPLGEPTGTREVVDPPKAPYGPTNDEP